MNLVQLEMMMVAGSIDYREFGKQMNRWKADILHRIDTVNVFGHSCAIASNKHFVDQDPTRSRLDGIMRSRSCLARIVGRTTRTLKNWDMRQCVPTGVRWYPPVKRSGNEVRYNVGENWEAILSMLPRERNIESDRQLAEEIINMKSGGEY